MKHISNGVGWRGVQPEWCMMVLLAPACTALVLTVRHASPRHELEPLPGGQTTPSSATPNIATSRLVAHARPAGSGRTGRTDGWTGSPGRGYIREAMDSRLDSRVELSVQFVCRPLEVPPLPTRRCSSRSTVLARCAAEHMERHLGTFWLRLTIRR